MVDDGSTDGTAEAIRKCYGRKCFCIHAKKTQESLQRATARSVRLMVSGWHFLDSDDEWLPSKIERQVDAVRSLGGEFGLCFTDCAFDDGTEKHCSAFQDAKFVGQGAFGPFEDPADYLLGPN